MTDFDMFRRMASVDASLHQAEVTGATVRLESSLSETLRKIDDDDTRKTAAEGFSAYERLFKRFVAAPNHAINWEAITPVPSNELKLYDNLTAVTDAAQISRLLSKLVVVKLNGGLGTTMGCTGPKSAIEVRDNMTFLDMTVKQIETLNTKYDVNVPLVLMNSFNTDVETKRILGKYNSRNVVIKTFNQSKCPRISKDTMLPAAQEFDRNEAWYPPGHGDLYESLCRSGLLEEPELVGRECLFISNADNLGATVDCNILNMMMNGNEADDEPPCNFIMEVTDKTRADVKGGTLCKYDGCTRLLELAQVPAGHTEEFKSIKKFPIFNTNNLWVKISALQALVERGALEMEIIVNPKTTKAGVKVIQLETAVGAAIKHFDGARGINVPRSRFLPVKGTSDLLLVKSDLYQQENGTLLMNSKRMFSTVPLVKLGVDHFTKVNDMLPRFSTIPNILELDHLTVTGDVTFGKDVTLKGTVIIVANHGQRIDIPQGAVLENKVVSGNLRILDH